MASRQVSMGGGGTWGGGVGLEREGKVEAPQDRFLKWVLRVQRSTPGYMIREEMRRGLLRGRTGMRAWGFERKLEEGHGGELARACWEELKGRLRGERCWRGRKRKGSNFSGKGGGQ